MIKFRSSKLNHTKPQIYLHYELQTLSITIDSLIFSHIEYQND
jgi:hypothetical protein